MASSPSIWLEEPRNGELAVSLVIPAFNEQGRLAVSLPLLIEAIRTWPSTEVIVVDDGSTDGTAQVALDCLSGLPNANVWRLPWNLGKGGAVRAGLAMCRGQSIVFMDADLSAELGDLPRLIGGLQHADVVVGSRNVPGSEIVGRSRSRNRTSGLFSWVVRSTTGVLVTDTQCGFKAMRAPAARHLSQLGRTNGFAFDVEMMSLARKLGYRIIELPIRWTDGDDSRVSVLRHGSVMLRDVLSIQWRHRRKRPTASALASVSRYEPPVAPLATSPQGRPSLVVNTDVRVNNEELWPHTQSEQDTPSEQEKEEYRAPIHPIARE